MKAEDYIWEINREILIHAQISKVWHIISSEGHLEKFHPFCKKNEVKVWDDSSHEDSIEYNNNRILNRNFYNWFEGKGFDLVIGDSKGNDSHVFWRISKSDMNTLVSITIKPYIYNKGSTLKNFIPFFTYPPVPILLSRDKSAVSMFIISLVLEYAVGIVISPTFGNTHLSRVLSGLLNGPNL